MPIRSPRRSPGSVVANPEEEWANQTGLAKVHPLLLTPATTAPTSNYSFGERLGRVLSCVAIDWSPPGSLNKRHLIDFGVAVVSQRRLLPPLQEPAYNFEGVPKAPRDLSGSGIQRLSCREDALACLAEMLMLCNEASRRSSRKPGASAVQTHLNAQRRECSAVNGACHHVVPGQGTKPLALEYLADRIDTDDPLHGYTVRTRDEGWLQGFVTITTFTTWYVGATYTRPRAPRCTGTTESRGFPALRLTAGCAGSGGIPWQSTPVFTRCTKRTRPMRRRLNGAQHASATLTAVFPLT